MRPEELSPDDESEFQKLEKIIQDNIEEASQCVAALATIRDHRLWREEANSFEEFCYNNWGFTRDLLEVFGLVEEGGK